MKGAAPPIPDAVMQSLVEDIHRQLGHDPTRPPALLTEVEAARILHQRPHTLQNWRCAGCKSLPWRKIGSATLYRARDLAAFIEGSKKEFPS